MRNITFGFLLLLMGTFSQAQAGLLTRGNIFAEGFAGCSIGVVVGLIGCAVLSSQILVASAVTQESIGHFMGMGCISGAAVALTMNSMAYFSDIGHHVFFDLRHTLGDSSTMIYPETPGKTY